MAENGLTNGSAPVRKLDALIIGAGVAGLYQLHQLRGQGLNVRAVDTASNVGGTWYWNRYPGSRFDSEAYIYQYLFSARLSAFPTADLAKWRPRKCPPWR